MNYKGDARSIRYFTAQTGYPKAFHTHSEADTPLPFQFWPSWQGPTNLVKAKRTPHDMSLSAANPLPS